MPASARPSLLSRDLTYMKDDSDLTPNTKVHDNTLNRVYYKNFILVLHIRVKQGGGECLETYLEQTWQGDSTDKIF